MKLNFKKILLCIFAASLMTISGNVLADNDASTTSQESSEENNGDSVRSVLKESEEPVTANYSEVTEFLRYTGSVSGIDIYSFDDDTEDSIWEKNGGKPEKKSDMTDFQESLSDTIKNLKKLGSLVAVNPDSKKVLAGFSKNNSSGNDLLYISNGSRYLLRMNSDLSAPISFRQVISTVDNPFLFSSPDGKTLELMDEKFENILFSYSESGIEDGRKVYLSKDKKAFAWLNISGDQVVGTFRICAENENFVLLIDDRLGNLGIKNKSDNYIWWSSPLEASRDKIATPLLVNELRSSNILRYGIPSKWSNNNLLRSASEDCKISVSDIENGVRVNYSYNKGFEFPVDYTLENDHLRASLKISDIKETDPENIATEITLLGGFGAASQQEDGYFVIPDGCGALVRFNNNKTSDFNAYSRTIYGNDAAAVPTSRGTVAPQVCLPVYGIVKEDNALLAIAAKGDSNASISASVSGQSNSSFNLCSFTFTLRNTDTFYMSGNLSDKITVFENGDILSDDIEVLYYPISKKNADFTDIAQCYRNYLISECGVEKKSSSGRSPLYVELYGGVLKKKPVFGIPVTLGSPVTGFSEAAEIVTELKNAGADDMVISYKNWTDDGISNKVDTGASPSSRLGGKREFSKLTEIIDENNFSFYPVADNRLFYSGNGYYSFSDTCVRVSGAYSRIVSYDRAYGIPDGFRKNMSLLSPEYFGEIFDKIAGSYENSGVTGVSPGDLTTVLYGDYGKKKLSRAKTMKLVTESFSALDDSLENGILANGANAYALPFAEHITNVPMYSGRFDIFNEDVPFYQAVVHGLIPYSSTAANASPDPADFLLRSAATGSLLNYDLIYADAVELKDTEFDNLFYANYSSRTAEAGSAYELLKPLFSKTADSFITGYKTENDGNTITTDYSCGTSVKVDMTAGTVSFDGQVINISDIFEGGEIP